MSIAVLVTSQPRIAHADPSQPHDPILINGNDEFTQDNGVAGGSGTSDDPYMISGWSIQAGDYGIEIANTTALFTIDDVQISCDPTGCGSGIVLSSIENGIVQNSQISTEREGIRVVDSQNFQITRNDIRSNVIGSPDMFPADVIFLYTVNSFDVSNNKLQSGFPGGCPSGIMGSYLSDASIAGNTGRVQGWGIDLSHLSGLLISGNNITAGCEKAISVDSCGDLTIDSNIASAGDTGIAVGECDNVLISNNTASNPYMHGIFLWESTNITVTSNIVSNDDLGIQLLFNANGNTITSNTISNDYCGIQTDSSTVDQNDITDNTFTGNTHDYC